MKYVLIWMVSLGVAIGLADESGVELAKENPVAAIIFAPFFAAVEVVKIIK